jgi:hypothetical protein
MLRRRHVDRPRFRVRDANRKVSPDSQHLPISGPVLLGGRRPRRSIKDDAIFCSHSARSRRWKFSPASGIVKLAPTVRFPLSPTFEVLFLSRTSFIALVNGFAALAEHGHPEDGGRTQNVWRPLGCELYPATPHDGHDRLGCTWHVTTRVRELRYDQHFAAPSWFEDSPPPPPRLRSV